MRIFPQFPAFSLIFFSIFLYFFPTLVFLGDILLIQIWSGGVATQSLIPILILSGHFWLKKISIFRIFSQKKANFGCLRVPKTNGPKFREFLWKEWHIPVCLKYASTWVQTLVLKMSQHCLILPRLLKLRLSKSHLSLKKMQLKLLLFWN